MISSKSFFISGIFMFVLGLGNFLVGISKSTEYQELSSASISLEETNPLIRVDLLKISGEHISESKLKALSRRDFYRLVEVGGLMLLILSLIPLVLSQKEK
jgi:hypothetical protein